MKLLSLILTAFTACGYLPHVQPRPRNAFAERFTVVRVDVYCTEPNRFNQIDWPDHIGHDPDTEWMPPSSATGVIISERHVLTAAHAVRCPIIPTVHVTLPDGRKFRMSVERDDAMFGSGADVARLEISTAESFGIGIPPPELAVGSTSTFGLFETWCAKTLHGDACGESGLIGKTSAAFAAVTRDHDSGAPVYDPSGRLVGLIVGRSDRSSALVRVTPYWLEGT